MTRQAVVIEQISPTSCLVVSGEHFVRDAVRRLGVKHMRDVRTGRLWLPALRVDDVAALLESRRHAVEIRQVLR